MSKIFGKMASVFLPENHERLEEVKGFAKELGGDLLAPEIGWKFSIAKTILGWRLGKKVKDVAWDANIYARRNWDRLFFILNNMKKSKLAPE